MSDLFVLPTDVGERIERALAREVARSSPTAYITRSDGRRRAGRPMRYFVHAGGQLRKLYAHSDDEAVVKANAWARANGLEVTP